MRKLRPLLGLILAFFLPASILSAQGVVVETVAEASAPEKAGVREGDVFYTWMRLTNPPIKPEPASGRLESPFDWEWMEIEQAPRGPVELRGKRQGKPLVVQVPIGLWGAQVRPVLPAELEDLYRRGKELVDKEQVAEGVTWWQQVAERAGGGGDWRLQTWIWLRIANAWYVGGAEKAATAYEAALRESRDPLSRIAVLEAMGGSFLDQGRLEEAEDIYRFAFELRKATWGESLQLACSMYSLGRTYILRSYLALVPEQRNPLLAAAQEQIEGTLAILERWAPGGVAVARSLDDLGIIAYYQGDLNKATMYFDKSISISALLQPVSRDMAAALLHRSKMFFITAGKAQALCQQALSAMGRNTSPSPLMESILSTLGNMALFRGDLVGAEDYLRRSLLLQSKRAPESLSMSNLLDSLGLVASGRGDLDSAQEYFERSLQLRLRIAHGTRFVDVSLILLGIVAKERGDLKSAQRYFREAVAFREQATESDDLIDNKFRGRHGDIYRDALRLQLEMGRPQEAFHLLERFRAQAFLALLAERDLTFAGDLSPGLDEERRRLAASYDSNQLQLAALDPEKDGEAIEALQREQVQLRRQREEIAAEIRRTAPRLAALQNPQARTFEQVREALDPGTVMLSYSVGKEQTHLFIVTQGRELQVETLEVGRETLEKDVDHYRQLIDQTRAGSALGAQGLDWFSRRLYHLLVEPAEKWIAAGKRIVLVPDGPLHLLPFAALTRKDGRHLVEWKPLSTVLSGTVFAELKKQRRDAVAGAEPSSLQWVAFGDPWFPPRLAQSGPEDIGEARLRSVSTRAQLQWKRLPQSRREVEEIATLFPPDRRRTYLDREASEERAKGVGKDVRIVHFATHGFVDDRSPFDSGLVLSIPEELAEGRDNGLLQVWEIFESVRLDADLVVLSACETGIGEIRGGEGIIGLTRAFQYAGARSVLASLWRIEDEATAELMQRFYRHLRAGKAKDEALRAAQLDLIRRPLRVPNGRGGWTERNAAAPYFWAALQLVGDGQ